MLKGILNDVSINETGSLSTEIIDYQNNDYIVPAVIEIFDQLEDIIKIKKITSNSKLITNKESKKLLEKLDHLLTDRFGYGMKVTPLDIQNAAIYPAPLTGDNSINDFSKNMEDMVATTNENPKDEDIDVDAATNSYKLWGKLEDRLYHNIKAMNKAIGKGVYIDLKKAKITGLPKDYVLTIVIDLVFFLKSGMTTREITGILFHEIGHGFTHIEYSTRIVKNTSVLVDTVKDIAIDRNRSGKEVIKIAEERLKVENKEKEEGNFLSRLLNLVTGVYKPMLSTDRHADTDSEQLADQFAARFGLADAVAGGLTKFGYNDLSWFMKFLIIIDSITTVMAVFSFIGLILAAGNALGSISGMTIMLVNGTTFSLFLPIAIFTIIVFIIASLLKGKLYDNPSDTYDEIKQRFSRLRLDLVRTLRTTKDKKLKKELLASIDNMDKLIKDLSKITGLTQLIADTSDVIKDTEKNLYLTVFETTKSLFGGVKVSHMRKIEEVLESLMENDLHIAAAKLKVGA